MIHLTAAFTAQKDPRRKFTQASNRHARANQK